MVRLIVILTSLFFSTTALAALEIFPKRVVFEPGQRSVEVSLTNGSPDDSYTYRLKWRQIQYNAENKVVHSNNNSHEAFVTPASSKMIRFAPRQVTLKPRERQTVRVFLRRPKNLEDGEYRSHLVFEEQAKVADAKIPGAPAGVDIKISYAIGISIPVIVRQGKGEPEVSVTNTHIKNNENSRFLNITLSKPGKYSSRVKFRLIQKQSGDETVVGERALAGIYTDTSIHKLSVSLNEKYQPSKPITIEVTYLGRGDKERTFKIVSNP